MFDLGSAAYIFEPRMDLPIVEKPNLKTGVGHGHYRPPSREKREKGFHKHKHVKSKMAKTSRRKNRK